MEKSIQKIVSNELITREFTVLDDRGNPLPDVEFLKTSANGNIKRIGLTDEDGKISVYDNNNSLITVSHVSGESVQAELAELDPVITFEPNELDEVVVTNEKTDYAGITVMGLLLAAGVSKAFKKPYQIAV